MGIFVATCMPPLGETSHRRDGMSYGRGRSESKALRAYDEVRRPFSQNVAQCSDMGGKAMQLRSPEFAELTVEGSATGNMLSPEQLRQVGLVLERASEWRFASTIEEDKACAFRKLEEAIGGRVR